MRRRVPVLAIVVSMIMLAACKSTPDGVLSHDDFVDLLVDFHKGEAYVDINYRDFREDSAKDAYQQSVFIKHGITQQDFDSTLMWYGGHVEEYISVYDDVIARLQDEANNTKVKADASLSVYGDSVNTWMENAHYVINDKSPSQFLTFYIEKDDNWEKGDSYTWQFKVFNRRSTARWTMVVEYTDMTSEYRTSEINQDNQDAWSRITLVVDSLRTPIAIYGYAQFNPGEDEEIYLDSVALIRNRYSSAEYRRRFNQRKFDFGVDNSSRNRANAEEAKRRIAANSKTDN